ncbi:dyp-type peroxidase [Lecanicillium saksenae]|uniref:Dyp-type peroxidase n=1 Tax=Lecanicillium saksenae TaxID=468837 RepID=A0ACC1QZQ3_9HYPO|nr:dyp-type peroxidase [Lecanicillium saksenae]
MKPAVRFCALLRRPVAIQIRIPRCARAIATMQPVDAPLTQSATFLVLSATNSSHALDKIRDAISSTGDLVKNVAIRHPGARLSCVVGIGGDIWDSLTGLARPKELRPFREIRGAKHTAIATPGDLLFHIRAERRDVTFEFESQLMELLDDAVKVEDSTVGFRYFDARDLLGFVDGTANPVVPDVADAVFTTAAQDAAAAGGSYVVVQKYVHDMAGWRGLSTEKQEAIIGRRKADNFELPDAADGKQLAHKTLATIEDEQGNEHDILRDNMPFGSPSSKQYGTYFIGYSKQLWVIEKMLDRMFVGSPPGLHDRILDYSKPLTGTTFFIPSASALESLGDKK